MTLLSVDDVSTTNSTALVIAFSTTFLLLILITLGIIVYLKVKSRKPESNQVRKLEAIGHHIRSSTAISNDMSMAEVKFGRSVSTATLQYRFSLD